MGKAMAARAGTDRLGGLGFDEELLLLERLELDPDHPGELERAGAVRGCGSRRRRQRPQNRRARGRLGLRERL